jgi:hypothetical protein
MRISLLPTLILMTLALAAPALAAPQDLRSPDARDAAAAGNAQSLQDIVRQHNAVDAALAQERYYSSYGKAAPLHRRSDGGTPWDAIAVGIVLIGVAAVGVGIAVRTRRRVSIAA